MIHEKISIEISNNLSLVHNELKEEIINTKNLKSVAKILKYLGTSTKEKSYRCLINTPYKNMFKSCSVCGKLMSSGMLKKSVLGICSGCLMKI